MNVKIAFFPHKREPRGTVREIAWEAFRDEFLSEHQILGSKDGPMFSFAIYGEGEAAQRANSNVTAVSGLVVDYDNSTGKGIDKRVSPSPTLPEDSLFNVEDYTCAWYSTYSHTRAWPHWRLLLPLSRPLMPTELSSAFDGLLSILARDTNIDMSCAELSRAHFLPAVAPERAGDAFLGAQTGRVLTPDELFDCARFDPKQNVVSLPAVIASGAGLARLTVPEGRNNTLKAMVAAMLGRGEALERIIAEVHQYDAAHHRPALFSDTSEGYRADSWSGAMRFVSSVCWSTATRRAASGLPPELPLIRSEALPPADLPMLRKVRSRTPIQRQEIAADLLMPSGAVGQMASWINGCAIKPQPMLALAASLAAFGTIIGRRVASPTDLRSNLYALGVAKSGAGKEHARKCVKKLFGAVGALTHLGGERLASDTGLIDAVAQARDYSCLFQLDEIGRLLSAIAGARQSPHLLNIPTVLMELYSSASSMFLGKQYASREREDLDQPCVCVYGTTVPGRFFSALSSDEVVDGFLARFLVFESDTDPEEQDIPADAWAIPSAIEQVLTERMAWPINADPRGNIDYRHCRPRGLVMGPGVELAFASLRKDVRAIKATLDGGDELSAIWNRASENAWKVALTLSAGIGDGDRITLHAAAEAIELVRVLTNNLCCTVQQRVAADRTDAVLKRCERLVMQAGAIGLSQSDLLRAMRCTSRDLRPLVDTLAESGQIVGVSRKSGQRATTYWVHIDYCETPDDGAAEAAP